MGIEQDYAIEVNNVSKVYKLYDKNSDRFKDALGFGKKKKLYREHYALNDVSFKVKTGECVGIIGTNGSGKSTMLKIITGVLNPTAGVVKVNGRISALLELGAGFNMEYTGIENVYLNGTMIGFTREEIDAKLQDILDFADIGDFVHQPVKTYSSGMFIRLAFAVAINIDPEILIVDEALSVGDVFFQSKCYHKFEEFKKQGKTILFVSHDLSSISKYCDRVVLINKGVKLAEGTPKAMVDMYKKVLVNQYKPEEAGENVDGAQAGGTDNIVKTGIVSGENTTGQGVGVKSINDADGKQFSLWRSRLEVNSRLLEYGDKEGEIIDFAVFDDKGNITTAIEKGTEFTVGMRVKFNQTLDEPIAAFTIKDIKGIEITGTNTLFEKVESFDASEGAVREIYFKQKMNLQGGNYLISFGCTGYRNGEFVVYHRLYDALGITVISGKDTVGFYDMESEVSVR